MIATLILRNNETAQMLHIKNYIITKMLKILIMQYIDKNDYKTMWCPQTVYTQVNTKERKKL